MNFWPAVLVLVLVSLSLPGTVPVLNRIPAKLTMPAAEPSSPKPALPAPPAAQEEEPAADSGSTYTDGVYKGSARGYGGMITVQVTVADKKIAEVSVLSAPGETGSFLSKAKGVIDRVIRAQTWEVDVVSGATYSSRGILGAVRNALTGETVENAKPPAQPKPKAPLTQQPFDDTGVWKDGTYIGSAMGFGGTIKVEVTIKGGRMDAIRVLQHGGETDSYFNKAKRVIAKILSAGTPNVDTISGATYSSNGIINAVKNALKKAAGGSGDSAQEDAGDSKSPAKTPAKVPARDDTEEPDLTEGLKDGTFTVDVECTDGRIFDYTIRLTMVVKNGKIQSIRAENIEDRSDRPDMNRTYLGYAVSGRTVEGKTYRGVISQILAGQTTKGVDIVSGATYSSEAILRGAKKLLAQAANDKKQAGGNGGDEDEKEQESGKKPTRGEEGSGTEAEREPLDEPEPENGLKDGTYSLEGICTDDSSDPLFDYTVLVTMKVENGEILSITAEIKGDRSEDPDTNAVYFRYATEGRTRKGVEYTSVIAQILDKQSTADIDVVSGATYSSRTILSTVNKLLWQAAKTSSGDPGEEESGPGGETEPSGEGSTGGETEPSGEGSTGGETEPSGEGSTGGETEPSGEGSTGGETEPSGESKTGEEAEPSGEGKTSGETDPSGEGSTGGETEPSGEGKTGGETEPSGEGSTGGETDSSGEGKTGGEAEPSGEGKTGGETEPSGEGGTGQNEKEETEKQYKDGTYSAKAHCIDDPDDPFFSYTVKVTVTVKDGKIADIRAERVDDESEDPEENALYMNYAVKGRTKKGKTYKGIPEQAIDAQSASGLDTVSGATYSSKAIIKALKEAVEDAK